MASKVSNILKYVEHNHRTFTESGFCNVDSLVLCQLFYVKLEEAFLDDVDFDSVMSGDIVHTVKDYWKLEHFSSMMTDGITDEENRQLFALMTASRRYRDLPVRYLVAETTAEDEKQFAACVYELTDDTDYLAFRGTDGSILGWKEDLNLAFKDGVPSQLEAVKYINAIYGPGGPRENRKLYIGGHSKGGNLAMYGAIMCDNSIKDRIIEVFCHDSPGFRDEVREQFAEDHEMDGLVVSKTVPQSSIIGMIMNKDDSFRIVKSSAVSIMQHSAFTWNVDGDDFVYLNERSGSSDFVEGTIRELLETSSADQLEKFSDALYMVLVNNSINSVTELKTLGPLEFVKMAKDINSFDEETRNALGKVLKGFASSAINNINFRPINIDYR